MLTIAIDFDDTFSAASNMWREFVHLAASYGHECILVTNRPEDMGNDVRAVVGDLMPIVFAGVWSKKSATARAGYDVDIWIDDTPEHIGLECIEYVGGDRPDPKEK